MLATLDLVSQTHLAISKKIGIMFELSGGVARQKKSVAYATDILDSKVLYQIAQAPQAGVGSSGH